MLKRLAIPVKEMEQELEDAGIATRSFYQVKKRRKEGSVDMSVSAE